MSSAGTGEPNDPGRTTEPAKQANSGTDNALFLQCLHAEEHHNAAPPVEKDIQDETKPEENAGNYRGGYSTQPPTETENPPSAEIVPASGSPSPQTLKSSPETTLVEEECTDTG